MNVGDFDTPIVLLERTVAVDSEGNPVQSFGNPITVFAEVVELTGGERFKSQMAQDMSERIARFTFWFTRTIKETDRITYDGANWDIVNVRHIGRKEQTELTAQLSK